MLMISDAKRLRWACQKPLWHGHLYRLRFMTSKDGYSLRCFEDKECIFVHVPKAAGVSLARTLFGSLAGGHASLSDYETVFPQERFERYFKFTFVRNPWDRVYSAYRFLRQGGMGPWDKKWADRHLGPYANFDDFVLGWLTEENAQRHIHFIPQSRLLARNGQKGLGVDFVGFFENIDQDFEVVAHRLGVRTQLKKENVKQRTEREYLHHYGPKARDVVARVYQRDIELLGYDFETSDLERQFDLVPRHVPTS